MAITWSSWMPTKPTNVVASLTASGTLVASTTYYVLVIACDTAETGVNRYDLSNTHINIWSPISDVINFTTDTINKSATVTWDKVYKRNGITEVDGYLVLLSTDPAIASYIDQASILKSGSYYTLTTKTNSYAITTPATLPIRACQNGHPFIMCSGSGTVSFTSLYDYLQTVPELAMLGAKIESFHSMRAGYKFLCNLMFYPTNDGDITFQSKDELILFYGSIYSPPIKKVLYDLRNNYIFLYNLTHGASQYFGGNRFTGSQMINCSIDAGIGTFPNNYPSGKQWVPLSTQTGCWDGKSATVDKVFTGNTFRMRSNSSIISGNDNYEVISRMRTDTQNGLTCDIAETGVYDFLSRGGSRFSLSPGDYTWSNSQDYRGWAYGMWANNLARDYQQGSGNVMGCFLDCDFTFSGMTGIADQKHGWNRLIEESGYYGSKQVPLTSQSMWKTIRIKVLDENGSAVPNAQVSFWGSNGTNLTHAVALTSKYLGGLAKIQDVNWDTNYSTITPTDTTQWFRQLNVSVNPTDGSVVWWKSEKIKLVSKRSDTGVTNGVRYNVEKGYDGTVPSLVFCPSSTTYYATLAPDYHLTNAEGKCYNPTLVWDMQHTLSFRDVLTTLEDRIALGLLNRKKYSPITVKIVVAGYETAYLNIPEDDIVQSGNVSINFIVTMDKVASATQFVAVKLDDEVWQQL